MVGTTKGKGADASTGTSAQTVRGAVLRRATLAFGARKTRTF